jgi:hypothetical protein
VSLKHFHLFFIACSLTLMVFLTVWANGQAAAGQPWPAFKACAAAGGALSLAYLGWFLRRYKTL